MKIHKITSALLLAAMLTSISPMSIHSAESIAVTDFKTNEETVSARVTPNGIESATAVAAVFDTTGRLIRTATIAVNFDSPDNIAVEIPIKVSKNESCKLMLLDNVNDLTPLTDVSEIRPERSFTDNLNLRMPSDKNYMFSPLSIKMALAMVANGAEGETQKEILDATGIDNIEKYNDAAKELIAAYSKSEGLCLSISNSIWLNTDESDDTFSDSFKSIISDYYDGTAQTVNNSNRVDEINGWVNEKTNGKISELIDDETEFITFIANAIYFKGIWSDNFPVSATEKEIFTDRAGEEKEIDFMKRTDMISYYNHNGVQMVRLPYKNSFRIDDEYTRVDANVAMYLALSDKENIDIDSIISDARRNEAFSSEYVDLWLPKFEVEYLTDLIGILDSMGIKRAFVPFVLNPAVSAQFGPMMTTNKDMIYINSATHKTFISVDEKGTEAAAVTGFGGGAGAAPSEPTPPPIPIPFHADEPFTFVIRDDSRDEILFIGEYAFAD